MLKTELLQDGKLIRTYSDTPGLGLLQTDTGIKYSEAVDLNPTAHTYKEIPMEAPQEDPEGIMREKAEAYDILMGGGA